MPVVDKSPRDCSALEIDDFVAFVLAGGEVSPKNLRKRVCQAERIAFLRRGDCLLGVAGLKRPEPSYRKRVEEGSEVALPVDDFPFELGWVFILPSARGTKQSLPLCQPVVAAAGTSGVFASSRTSLIGMHITLGKLGFERAGAEWPSKQHDDKLRLFIKAATDATEET